MARPRTPSNILELRGSFKRHPEIKRPNEPKSPYPIGECPDHLDADDQAAWNEIVSQCCPGVLTVSDRITVEITARLLAELRETGRDFNMTRLARLQSLLASLGMNPADRTKISVEPPSKVNKFAALSG